MQRTIAFRVDASVEIGSGHVMRCLTLADELRRRGGVCIFICRNFQGNLFDTIRENGFEILELPKIMTGPPNNSMNLHEAWLGTEFSIDAEQTISVLGKRSLCWLVVDHYALDSRWESQLRCCAKKIMVIDDLADRPHDCDLLLDQNIGRKFEDYENKISASSIMLLGPKYALIRPEFSRLRPYSLARRKNPSLSKVLVAMGGVDKDNITSEVLKALDAIGTLDFQTTVVLGRGALWYDEVRELSLKMKHDVVVLRDVKDLGRIMSDSDLAIGAGGGTAWERCSLGLPSLIMAIALNQREGTTFLDHEGAAVLLSNPEELVSLIECWIRKGELAARLVDMSLAARRVTSGKGTKLTSDRLISYV